MGFFSKLFGGKGGVPNKPNQPSKPAPPLKPGKGVEELARRLNLSVEALQGVEISYSETKIKKRDGSLRVLHVPNPALKTLQKTLLRRLLSRLQAHPAAMGFERGKSIATNAAAHVGARIVLKMDLKEFFTQTPVERVGDYFVTIGWDKSSAKLLTKITTHHGLPQGAPTSPRLSNLLNYGVDARLFALALKTGAAYTRYADDLTFSWRGEAISLQVATNPNTGEKIASAEAAHDREAIGSIIQCTKMIIEDYGYTLHQKKKLQVRRRKHQMLVTGVVVNEKLNLPRATRRRLRAVAHHLKTNRPATMTEKQLRGWRALEAMIVAARGSADDKVTR